MADSAGLGRDVRLVHWVYHKWSSRAGETAWVGIGGVRQGAASHQMPNPAKPRRNPQLATQKHLFCSYLPPELLHFSLVLNILKVIIVSPLLCLLNKEQKH